MSDYTQITSFAPKDSLTTGDPNKKLRGSELDPEFSAIATAIQSKFDSNDIASDAEAAALTVDTKLITPDKLAHALQNGSLTLGANILLNGGFAASDIARLSQANEFEDAVTATAEGASFVARRTGASADSPYITFEEEDGTLLGYLQANNAGANIELFNGVSGGDIELVTSGGGDILANGLSVVAGLKVAYCRVNTDGSLNTSYASKNVDSTARDSTGTYTITHTSAGFTEPPIILAISVVAAISTNTQFTGSETTITRVTTSNDLASGALADRAFYFLAIGA